MKDILVKYGGVSIQVNLKIILVLILQLLWTTAFPSPTTQPDSYVPYIENPEEYFSAENYRPTIVLGEEVVIRNREAYATPLFPGASFQYEDMVLGIYVNGVKARRLHRWDGKGDKSFVEIAIEGDGLNAGFSGWIEERHLVCSVAQTFDLPVVTLETDGEEGIALYTDYAEDTPVIATYPNGTQAHFLGYLDRMCHVQIDDQSGFVKTSQLYFPPEVAQALEEGMRSQFFDYSPTQKHGGEICRTYENELRPLYGGRSTWPLWVQAEFSALCMKYDLGTGFMFGMYVMPGPDDLPQQDAIDIAAQDVSDRFDIPLETLLEQYTVSVSFFEADRTHTGRYWRIVFDPPPGEEVHFTEAYVRSPSGEVVDF